MAEGLRTFTVNELLRQSDGTFTDSGVRFEWDSKHQSSPRPSWEFGQRQRTHREDYPGSDIPSEQILGPNFKSFKVRGVWDDRYNYSGFAEDTRKAFEALVQRGNFVRLEFEGITITGIITEADYVYRRASYQSYEFDFSPHFRNSGGDARQQGRLAPQAVSDPQTYADQAAAICLQARQLQSAAPLYLIASSLVDNIGGTIDTLTDRLGDVQSIVNNRVIAVDPATQSVNSISRLVQSFSDMQAQAVAALGYLGQTSSTDGLDYETADLTLAFEVWQRELGFTMRQMIVLAAQAAAQLALLVQPKTLAYYRPHKGESLYGIANQFFNAPERWRDIYLANNLQTIVLTGTELLIIPDMR